MPYPGISIGVSGGNLLRAVTAKDGVGAIVATAQQVVNIGEVKQVYDLQDAIAKGYTETNEPLLFKHLKEFYSELGGKQKVYVYGTSGTDLMADLVDSTNEAGLIKLLTAAQGEITVIALSRKANMGDYLPGAAFLDADVENAVIGSLPLCQAWQAKNTPFRLLIDGIVANDDVPNDFAPNTANNGFVGVVLGGTSITGNASVALALARACKYESHVKIGSGQNGALTAEQIYIGSVPFEQRMDMETLHDAGFITFQRRAGAAGYYFGVDNMATADDFRILVHGRVIDKAQRIAAQAYLPYIEGFINVDGDGSPSDSDCVFLETVLSQAIKANMGDQISKVKVVIDPAQGAEGAGIISTSTLQGSVAVMPKGYLTWIVVNMGLTAQITE